MKLLATAGIAALAACAPIATPAPAPTVTVTQQATPEAVDAPTLTAEQDRRISALALEYAWDGMSASEQENICLLYNTMPDYAWQRFDEGAEGQLTRAQFEQFFDGAC